MTRSLKKSKNMAELKNLSFGSTNSIVKGGHAPLPDAATVVIRRDETSMSDHHEEFDHSEMRPMMHPDRTSSPLSTATTTSTHGGDASSPHAAASSSSPTSSSRRLYRDLIHGLAGSVHIPNLLQGSTTGMRTSLIPIFAKELGADDGMIGIITAAAGVARMLVSIPAGHLTTSNGFTVVMNAGMASVALGSVIAAVAWSPWILAVANVFFGAGIGIFFLSRHVMLAAIVDKTQRGRLMSLIGGGERWSSVIGPAVGGVLIELGGSRLCSIAMAPIVLACALCISRSGRVRLIDEKFGVENTVREALEREGGQEPQRKDVVFLFRSYGGLIVRVGVFAMNILQLRACRRLLLPLAAINAGLRPSVVGLMLSFSFAIDATLFFLGGMIMDRFGRKFSAIPTSVNLGLAFFVLAEAESTWSLFVAAAVFGFSDSLGAGLLLTLNADHAPKKAGPEFMGVLRSFQDSGQLFGPLIAGLVAQTTSFQTACNLFGILGLVNAVWAACMLPSEASDEDVSREQQPSTSIDPPRDRPG